MKKTVEQIAQECFDKMEQATKEINAEHSKTSYTTTAPFECKPIYWNEEYMKSMCNWMKMWKGMWNEGVVD